MERKEWNLYTLEEKKEILRHWWHYYGKLAYTFAELELFNQLLDENADKIYLMAIQFYQAGLSSQLLIGAMRSNGVDSLLAQFPDLLEIDQRDIAYTTLSGRFLDEVVKTLNNPEPDIPMDPEELIKQIKKAIGRIK